MKTGLKQVTSEIWLTIIGLVVGTTVGIVFNRLSPTAVSGISGLVGAVVFLFVQMLGLRIRVDQNAKQHQETLSALAAGMVKKDAERVLLEIGLIHADTDLSADQTVGVWRELTWNTRHNYSATNFIEPEGFYKSGHAQNVLQLQKTKLRAQPNFTMKKVLIWKDTGERDSQAARTVVKMHLDDHEAGMQLKGILREEIEQKALLRKPLHEELGTQVDFGIFDDMVVLVWTLDDKRMPLGGKVIVGDKQVAAFRMFFNNLVQEAQALSA